MFEFKKMSELTVWIFFFKIRGALNGWERIEMYSTDLLQLLSLFWAFFRFTDVTKAMSPLIFILSPGADPGSNLYRFAAEMLG